MPAFGSMRTLAEDDEDIFSRPKADSKTKKVRNPGAPVATLEVPNVQSIEQWGHFIHMLSTADGLIVLRPMDVPNKDDFGYLYGSDIVSSIYEAAETKSKFIITVVKGPLRGPMLILAAVSRTVLATTDATFACQDYSKAAFSPAVATALKKKGVTEAAIRRMTTTSRIVEAREAQQMRIVDFVGDEETVENEVCRCIYRVCKPEITYMQKKADLIDSLREREADEDDEDEDED